MERERLTAFTDGVIAVIITIMVLDLKVPPGARLKDLATVAPTFLGYVLSFIGVAMYWNNHHHFFYLVPQITGRILWANLNLLFWLSLIPFTTGWMGEHYREPLPAAVYGISLLMSALSWYLLQNAIIRMQGPGSALRDAIGSDAKGKASPLLYVAGIGLAFVNTWLAYAVYAGIAAMWLIPDRRVESVIARPQDETKPKA